MPVFATTGTLNPDAGISAQQIFVPASALDGVRGHCPPPLVGQDGTYFLAADATWKPALSASLVPVIRFTGSAAGGTGQTFTNTLLGRYALAEDIQLFVEGTTPIRLFGNTTGGDFTLLGTTITVSYALPANANLFIDSKVITGTSTETYYILTELGDTFQTEDGANLLRKEQNT